MRGRIISLAGIILLFVSSCGEPRKDEVVLVLKSARAINCKDTCSDLLLNIYVENNTNNDMCMSSRNITSAISRSIYITNWNNREPPYETKTVFEDESAPNIPGRIPAHLAMLRVEPKIFIQSHKTLQYYAETGDKYKIPKTPPLLAKYQVYFYECHNNDDRNYVQRLSSAQIQF